MSLEIVPSGGGSLRRSHWLRGVRVTPLGRDPSARPALLRPVPAGEGRSLPSAAVSFRRRGQLPDRPRLFPALWPVPPLRSRFPAPPGPR